MWSYNFAQKLISDYGVCFDCGKVSNMAENELCFELDRTKARKTAKAREEAKKQVEYRVLSWVESPRLSEVTPFDLYTYRQTWLFFHMVELKK
jgi:hypothetical protein